MHNQHGVMLIMYDLPVTSAVERRSAVAFRKALLRLGYASVQESVYAKLTKSPASLAGETAVLYSLLPAAGSVKILPLTLKEFRKMTTLLGSPFNMELFGEDIIQL